MENNNNNLNECEILTEQQVKRINRGLYDHLVIVFNVKKENLLKLNRQTFKNKILILDDLETNLYIYYNEKYLSINIEQFVNNIGLRNRKVKKEQYSKDELINRLQNSNVQNILFDCRLKLNKQKELEKYYSRPIKDGDGWEACYKFPDCKCNPFDPMCSN